MTNCLNCGAPLDKEYEKCPYCGTSYYDMSAITLDGHTPFVLKIKTKVNNQEVYITQLCVASTGEFILSHNTTDICSGRGEKLLKFCDQPTLSTNITFEAVPNKKGILCEVRK